MYLRSRLGERMNPYKAAWYAHTLVEVPERPVPEQRRNKDRVRNEMTGYIQKEVTRNMVSGAALGGLATAATHAAQSQIAGRVGVTLRVGGRIGLRVIPVVGVALLAYDLYQFGKWVTQE